MIIKTSPVLAKFPVMTKWGVNQNQSWFDCRASSKFPRSLAPNSKSISKKGKENREAKLIRFSRRWGEIGEEERRRSVSNTPNLPWDDTQKQTWKNGPRNGRWRQETDFDRILEMSSVSIWRASLFLLCKKSFVPVNLTTARKVSYASVGCLEAIKTGTL